jgi:hypothetical protein
MSQVGLQVLCDSVGESTEAVDVIAARDAALQGSVQRGLDADDFKSIAGEVYVAARRILALKQIG